MLQEILQTMKGYTLQTSHTPVKLVERSLVKAVNLKDLNVSMLRKSHTHVMVVGRGPVYQLVVESIR